MPELPEVESIRLKLVKYLRNHIIENVVIRFPRIFSGDKEKLEGGKVIGVRRFGKAQAIDLNNGYSILIHIKMTGQLLYEGPNLKRLPQSMKISGGAPGKHTHVIFHLDRGGKLYYNDLRKFGWIRVIKTNEVLKNDFVANLGPEPFVSTQGKPGKLTLEYFQKMIGKSMRPIKITLMDQSKIGGIGNIYANDALWLARIDPKKPGKSLNTEEQKQLYAAVHTVLKDGIKYGGSSENSYVTPDGQEGSYQDHTLVYGKTGEVCRNCKKNKIEKFFLGGRGTYFCNFCQR